MGGGKLSYEELQARVEKLEIENKRLKTQNNLIGSGEKTVNVPEGFESIFDSAQDLVRDYFTNLKLQPTKGSIEINDQRYVLVRASALSNEFFNNITGLYANRGKEEAFEIGKKFLFDIGHVLGLEDAKQFHKKMNVVDPLEKLSAGPVHFAYSGWAFVDILPDSNPSPDENYFLKYNHPYSFEADSWLRSGVKSDHPVCIMNAAYSSGWSEQSYGFPLTAVEITCKAKGDDNCTFIMAPPHKIQEYIDKEDSDKIDKSKLEIPFFFERKKIEEQLNENLKEKEILLKEIHHRVKNNLQIISSLLNLQLVNYDDPVISELLATSKNRIKTMSLVHEKLYGSKDLSKIQLGKYIDSIHELHSALIDDQEVMYLNRQTDDNLCVGVDTAILLGLVVNEMFSNTYKYAFDSTILEPKITVEIYQTTENLYVSISDNGVGIGQDIQFPNKETLGFELMLSLIEQADGDIDLVRKEGTKFEMRIGLHAG